MNKNLVSLFLFCFLLLSCMGTAKKGENKLKDVNMLIPGYWFAQETDSIQYNHWLAIADSVTNVLSNEEEWYDFLQNGDGAFCLKKAYPQIKNQYIDCWDEHAITLSSEGIVLLCGSSFTGRVVPSVILPEEFFAIFPGDSLVFDWKNKKYRLRAEADSVDMEAYNNEGLWDGISNYRLYLLDGEKEQLFFEQEAFHNTRSELLFVGDLDNDGLPDMLISNPSDYESVSLILYLSSYASEEELIGIAASGGYDVSC